MPNLGRDKKGFSAIAILLFLSVLVIGFLVGKTIGGGAYLVPLAVAAGLVVCVIAFINTEWALIILAFSMLLSPEIPVANLPERAVTVRIEDFFVILMFFGWFAKMAVNKQLGLFRKTPVNRPISLYVLILIIATARGMLRETVVPVGSFFFLLKYIEYIMIFFMVANNIKSLKQVKVLIFCFLVVYVIVSANSIRQLFESNFGIRAVSAPFDVEGHPEPNTLGGYLLFLIGINLGLFLYEHSLKRRLLLIGAFALTIMPFLWTFSRSSWLGFIPMFLILLFFGKRMKIFLLAILILGVVFLPQIVPEEVTHRVLWTFRGGVERQLFGRRVEMDSSAAARIDAWTYQVTELLPENPLLGRGVTGVGLTDSQYFRILGEAGLIGFSMFIWMLVSIFRIAWSNFKTLKEDWLKGFSLGFLAGYSGLLVQALTTNVFIIVRIMEPFMFMAAIMAVLKMLPADVPKPDTLK